MSTRTTIGGITRETIEAAIVLRAGQPTLGMRLSGTVIVEVPACPCCRSRVPRGMTFELVHRWVQEAVMTRARPGIPLRVLYRFE